MVLDSGKLVAFLIAGEYLRVSLDSDPRISLLRQPPSMYAELPRISLALVAVLPLHGEYHPIARFLAAPIGNNLRRRRIVLAESNGGLVGQLASSRVYYY